MGDTCRDGGRRWAVLSWAGYMRFYLSGTWKFVAATFLSSCCSSSFAVGFYVHAVLVFLLGVHGTRHGTWAWYKCFSFYLLVHGRTWSTMNGTGNGT